MRERRRKYEETHKEERKERNGQFSTFIPREDFEEINVFLRTYGFTKVNLIYAGYKALQEEVEKEYD